MYTKCDCPGNLVTAEEEEGAGKKRYKIISHNKDDRILLTCSDYFKGETEGKTPHCCCCYMRSTIFILFKQLNFKTILVCCYNEVD